MSFTLALVHKVSWKHIRGLKVWVAEGWREAW